MLYSVFLRLETIFFKFTFQNVAKATQCVQCVHALIKIQLATKYTASDSAQQTADY